MKKGFTLIEIIIVITLIVLIGTFGAYTLMKPKEIDSNITNQIIEATNAFINIETDESGNSYHKGISLGAKGVQITVKNLIDTGYLEESVVKTLEDTTGEPREELKILATISEDQEIDCDSSTPIKYTVSWSESSEPIYLCPYNKKESASPLILSTDCPTDKISDTTYGKFCYTSDGTHYFKGAVTNNYVKFGKYTSSGESLLWRIVWVKDDVIKLILNNRLLITKIDNTYARTECSNKILNFCQHNDCSGLRVSSYFKSNDNGRLYFGIKGTYKPSNGSRTSFTDSYSNFTWDDSVKTTMNNSIVSGNLNYNPLYFWIYYPLTTWWNSTNLEGLISEKSKWCIYGTETECTNDNYIYSKYGLPYRSDYNLALINKNIYNNNDSSVNYDYYGLYEIVFKIDNGIEIHDYSGGEMSVTPYLRPTIYVDLSRLKHAENEVDEGTESNPYIIE